MAQTITSLASYTDAALLQALPISSRPQCNYVCYNGLPSWPDWAPLKFALKSQLYQSNSPSVQTKFSPFLSRQITRITDTHTKLGTQTNKHQKNDLAGFPMFV